MVRQRQLVLDVINGQVLFPQGDGQLTDAVAHGRLMRSGLGVLEESGAFLGVVTELVAEDAQGVGGITEVGCDLRAGPFVHEEGAQGFVLAVEGGFGSEEELGLFQVS